MSVVNREYRRVHAMMRLWRARFWRRTQNSAQVVAQELEVLSHYGRKPWRSDWAAKTTLTAVHRVSRVLGYAVGFLLSCLGLELSPPAARPAAGVRSAVLVLSAAVGLALGLAWWSGLLAVASACSIGFLGVAKQTVQDTWCALKRSPEALTQALAVTAVPSQPTAAVGHTPKHLAAWKGVAAEAARQARARQDGRPLPGPYGQHLRGRSAFCAPETLNPSADNVAAGPKPVPAHQGALPRLGQKRPRDQ